MRCMTMDKYVVKIHGCECEVFDGVESYVTDIENCLEDVIGVRSSGDGSSVVVAEHTKMDAGIYSHIHSLDHHISGALPVGNIYDLIALTGRRTLISHCPCDTILVNTASLNVNIGGYRGSVVRIIDRMTGTERVCSLCAALGVLSREARVPLLKYDTIGLFSDLGGCKSLIRFKKSEKSRLYRTKLCLDMVW